MDAPKSDLVVAIVGAIVLVGLVAGLFVLRAQSPPPTTDGPTSNGDGDGNGTMPPVDWDNKTFSGTIDPGAYAGPDADAAQSETRNFTVPNGTVRIHAVFELGDGQGDLGCHLFDPDDDKLGDSTCHEGSPDDPQGGEVLIEGKENITAGNWTFVAHTEKGDDANVNLERDWSVDIEVKFETAG